MSEDEPTQEPEVVENGIKGMHIKNGDSSEEDTRVSRRVDRIKQEATSNSILSSRKGRIGSTDQSPSKSSKSSQTSDMIKDEHEQVIGGDITVKMEPGQPPKLARTSSQKITPTAVPLFHGFPNKTEEAKETFQLLPSCTYTSKYIGSTEHALDCDCTEEWDNVLQINAACGDDSDCINRATKMECYGDCGCGSDCQNQRFQRQQYAKVTVIKTEKKGYGLRADTDLRSNDFIYEYIGEVINETQFRRRMVQYDEEGIKHFYFMSLTKGEFVDATKKGNLGRFCNHSCNPNCYVDKWVVGDKLRMGIFAERKIKAGEELVFNYNVDRYGADPQPCYCGEPNCSGYIGGKTQTERATKLSNTTIEALGIDDAEGWDTAVARKPRKKKVGEDDEEYVNNVQPKSLDETGVTKVMATLIQCKEKWIAVKLLGRIQQCNDERVRNRVVKMHGYQILNSALALWKEDFNVVLQILDILNHFPRLTRNKISDSKIESTVENLRGCGDDRVELQVATLIQEWNTLEVAYRIPRKKRDPNAFATPTPDKPDRFDRRSSRDERKARSKSRSPSRSSTASVDAPRGPAAPTGPRAGAPPRPAAFYTPARPPYRPRIFNPNALPPGWFSATSNGSTYYYSATGQTTWTKPTTPAQQQPPPPPPRPVSTNKALEDIINEITQAKANTPKDKTSASATPLQITRDTNGSGKEGKEKWRSYPEEKKKRLYENTLFPHIKHVMDKFKGKLPKDDLKRFAKEIGKKLVNSDFKNKRVTDPTRISSHQEAQVKKFVKDYFTKAVAKKDDFDKKKTLKDAKAGGTAELPSPVAESAIKAEEESEGDQGMDMSDGEDEKEAKIEATPITPIDQMVNGDGLKRKRLEGEMPDAVAGEEDLATPTKRLRSTTPPPPPPPPPPPEEDAPGEQSMIDSEDGDVYEVSPYNRQQGGRPDIDIGNENPDTTDLPLSPAITDQPRRNDLDVQGEPPRGYLIEHSQQLEIEGGA